MVDGEMLKQWRKSRGWSLREAAEKSGVSKSLIAEIEKNAANPTADTLNKLCTAYGKTMADLFKGGK